MSETQAEWDKSWSDEKQKEGKILFDKSVTKIFDKHFSKK